jgi:ribosomal protein S18 acetylase RimI-like enzyme
VTAVNIEVRRALAGDLPSLQPLWNALYEKQIDDGMLLPYAPEGFASWSASFAPVLGKFAAIALAIDGSDVVGFVAARVRLIPAHFGGGTAGFVSEVYTAESHRGQGLARRMIDDVATFFRAQGVKRLELQVLMNNEGARAAYQKLGWKDELVQMALDL